VGLPNAKWNREFRAQLATIFPHFPQVIEFDSLDENTLGWDGDKTSQTAATSLANGIRKST
jgi:hypothetical protein